jgi:HEAT repeat protein
VSVDIIKALNKCLLNPKPEIRQAALNSLGVIGLPDAFDSIEEISKCLWDKDSRCRSMACWAISKIC